MGSRKIIKNKNKFPNNQIKSNQIYLHNLRPAKGKRQHTNRHNLMKRKCWILMFSPPETDYSVYLSS